jgi:hypothetical protein
MPKITHQSKPIKVYENETHFFVEICAKQKHRASNIPKRRWNRHITAWVYPKTIELYEALEAEFKMDAEIFDINRPRISRMSSENFESEVKGAYKRSAEINKNDQQKLDEQFNVVIDKLDRLTKHVEKIEDNNDAMQGLLLEQVSHTERLTYNHEEESHVASDESLEMALMLIAFETSGRDESFKQHLSNHHPLTKPERFITRTHHLLGDELASIAGLSEMSRKTFLDKILILQEQNLFNSDKGKSVPQTLKSLNHHRNQVAHNSNMSEYELKSRSITYLMGLASIWDEVASEPV